MQPVCVWFVCVYIHLSLDEGVCVWMCVELHSFFLSCSLCAAASQGFTAGLRSQSNTFPKYHFTSEGSRSSFPPPVETQQELRKEEKNIFHQQKFVWDQMIKGGLSLGITDTSQFKD